MSDDAKMSETPQEPVLVAENVVKELGSGPAAVMALKGVSLELVPGELTLLMGPSGSGKTTLLSILGCILAPTAGTVQHCWSIDFWFEARSAGQDPAQPYRIYFPVL